jgi:hypothetical protein
LAVAAKTGREKDDGRSIVKVGILGIVKGREYIECNGVVHARGTNAIGSATGFVETGGNGKFNALVGECLQAMNGVLEQPRNELEVSIAEEKRCSGSSQEIGHSANEFVQFGVGAVDQIEETRASCLAIDKVGVVAFSFQVDHRGERREEVGQADEEYGRLALEGSGGFSRLLVRTARVIVGWSRFDSGSTNLTEDETHTTDDGIHKAKQQSPHGAHSRHQPYKVVKS